MQRKSPGPKPGKTLPTKTPRRAERWRGVALHECNSSFWSARSGRRERGACGTAWGDRGEACQRPCPKRAPCSTRVVSASPNQRLERIFVEKRLCPPFGDGQMHRNEGESWISEKSSLEKPQKTDSYLAGESESCKIS